jgi:hypothetical protein
MAHRPFTLRDEVVEFLFGVMGDMDAEARVAADHGRGQLAGNRAAMADEIERILVWYQEDVPAPDGDDGPSSTLSRFI